MKDSMKNKLKVPLYDPDGELQGYDLIDRKTGKCEGWLPPHYEKTFQFMMKNVSRTPGFEEEMETMKQKLADTELKSEVMEIKERLAGVPVGDRLDITQAAQYLKISDKSVRRRIRDGSIPAIKVGNRYQFKRSDLDAYLEAQRRIVPPFESTDAGGSRKRKVNYDKIVRNMKRGKEQG